MDRRQRKTREAIFTAFSQLLSRKDFNQITVGQIIEQADVGRATFYAHFETKDHLLQAFCEELFCHIFDSEQPTCDHRHIFQCDGADSAFLHLIQHLQQNDHNILTLLSSRNNELFLQYFHDGLVLLIRQNLSVFAHRKAPHIPDDFWEDHIASVFVSTLKWWLNNGMRENPETIARYFMNVV